MINAKLIMVPAFDRGGFVHEAEAVTGKNHLRSTDSKNLPNELAEQLSILEDFGGYAEAGRGLLNIGFLFTGTVDNIDLLPTIIGGQYVRTMLARSPILGAVIVVAPIVTWEQAVTTVARCDYGEAIKKTFQFISSELFKIERRTDLPRITV